MIDIMSSAKSHSLFPRKTSANYENVGAADDTELSDLIIDNFYNGHDDHYAIQTDPLESLSFAKYGLVCRRSDMGPRNNLDINQCGVEIRSIEWIGLSSKNDHRFAAYILDEFTKTRHCRLSDHRLDDPISGQLCKYFTDDMLNDIPPHGGQIPFSIIGSWLERKRRDI